MLIEEKKYMLELKNKEYEIYRLLSQMNVYRFYAKFANQILDGDTTRFEKPILSDLSELDKIDFEPIIKEVIDNYSTMKKFDIKKDKKNDQKILKYYKEEGYFLDDPELLYHKFTEIEGNIIRLLQKKEKLILKMKKKEIRHNEKLSYLNDKCNIFQKEYDEIKAIYNEEKENFLYYIENNGMTHINVNIHEKNNLIQDLYMSVIEEFEPTIMKISSINKKEFNLVDRKELVHYDEIVNYGENVLKNIEINLNCFLIQMKNDEINDKNLFDKVIYGIKNEYKLLRQSLFFKNKKEKEKKQINKINEKANKIVLFSKKSAPPYYKIKENKKIKVNLNLNKKGDDKDFFTYH